MTASVSTSRAAQRFTAVDLVTLAVFAAMYRALWYFWHAVGFLWPFNIVLNGFFFGLTAITAAMIVRKFGTFTLYTIAAQAINFFLQGEALSATIVMLLWGVGADAYVYLRQRAGQDPFSSFRDMVISAILLGVIWQITVWWVVFAIIYMIEMSFGLYLAAAVTTLIGVIVGGALGFGLGNRVKGLIG